MLKKLLITASSAALMPLVIAGSASAASLNLLVNGSFESPDIRPRSYSTINPIPGWSLTPDSARGAGIEIQDNVAGSPFAGSQFAELDGRATSGIFQNISTVVGRQYQLSFAFSPRPGERDNRLNVFWDGATVANLTASGAGRSNTNWNVFTYNLVANDTITTLRFDNFGELSNTRGTYIDDVSVVAVAVPEAGSILGVLMVGVFGASSAIKRKHA
ncbi:DUF642 domain-containing protein [Nostoc cycadae]|uniref:Calcium-binding protein n=1 Tax=Nostoc cycadae WK-1 TaxID=1861711 RepID=A0A2H6LLL7_9NOSO|nr:DUF642 domain-containing protein [Nostoc cycadae]GBE94046.1 calcium-binding protein [Nostoc cycadae WK-1]